MQVAARAAAATSDRLNAIETSVNELQLRANTADNAGPNNAQHADGMTAVALKDLESELKGSHHASLRHLETRIEDTLRTIQQDYGTAHNQMRSDISAVDSQLKEQAKHLAVLEQGLKTEQEQSLQALEALLAQGTMSP